MSTSTPTGDISNPMPSTAAGVTTDPPGQNGKSFTFIVEHLDPELGPWSALEYKTIARECREFCNQFFLSSISKDLVESGVLADVVAEGGEVERRAVEVVFPPRGGGSVADARDVQAEGRGGERICLLDPRGEKELCPEDGERFEGFLFGGILGDDPPRDRTAELRQKGYEGRRLGPKQMTTDTAVRVTRMVVQGKVPLHEIPYIDFPELKLDEHESTEMPFRYVKGEDGKPVMPEGMIELIKKDADKGFEDFL